MLMLGRWRPRSKMHASPYSHQKRKKHCSRKQGPRHEKRAPSRTSAAHRVMPYRGITSSHSYVEDRIQRQGDLSRHGGEAKTNPGRHAGLPISLNGQRIVTKNPPQSGKNMGATTLLHCKRQKLRECFAKARRVGGSLGSAVLVGRVYSRQNLVGQLSCAAQVCTTSALLF